METKVFAQSFLCNRISFIKINNIPLLSFTTIVAPNTNCLAFFVFASFNFNDFAVLPVDELVVLIFEYLEPIRVGTPDLHVICSS